MSGDGQNSVTFVVKKQYQLSNPSYEVQFDDQSHGLRVGARQRGARIFHCSAPNADVMSPFQARHLIEILTLAVKEYEEMEKTIENE